jgi:hypothetical protein
MLWHLTKKNEGCFKIGATRLRAYIDFWFCILAENNDGDSGAHLRRPEHDRDCESMARWAKAYQQSVLDVLETSTSTVLDQPQYRTLSAVRRRTLTKSGETSRTYTRTSVENAHIQLASLKLADRSPASSTHVQETIDL